MPYESGGRADKLGNRFEIRWTIYQILEVIDEKIDYIILEALGDDERGVDIWVGKKNGTREGQQCKGRNASKEYWDYGTANAKGIFYNWKFQLDQDELNTVSLVSPLAFTMLEDLIIRAKNTSSNFQDFYNNQILSSGKELKEFFKNFCRSMDLNPDIDVDLIRCISFLKKISYRQYPDSELKELILAKINYLFLGDEEDIYNTLVAWIIDGDVLGIEINQFIVNKLLINKSIKLKNLANDARILPRLEELNREYSSVFVPLDNGLIDREEFSLCRTVIESGESLIIHGKAGRGKSGSTEDIVRFCSDKGIPYIAIKLDKRIPSRTAEKWGNDLGLPSSIVHCVHSIYKTKNAVIILDQLDALRWTQAHSRESLIVCTQIIDQVERLNMEREKKISVVFVCRTYDLENDNNIKSLFDEKKREGIQWNKVQIKELNDEIVKEVIGDRYNNLTGKLKDILKVPSNIYIWRKLDGNKQYNECSSTSQLVSEWWTQLEKKCFSFGLNEADLNETKEKIIDCIDKLGRISIPTKMVHFTRSSLDFLTSNDFLLVQNNKISFAHQSILDYFLVEKMLRNYYENSNILEIIGSKERQTPGRRYQVQMLLQNLIEFDSEYFLNAGLQMLASEQIRFSVKFVFFEVLNQLDVIDDNIKNYIVENCENETYGDHIINSVIYSKPQYVKLLRESGVLDRWFVNSTKKNDVLKLITSISPSYEAADIAFIEKYAFQSQEDDTNFSRCFLNEINYDTDEQFELRMKFYYSYPHMAQIYLDFKLMIRKCEMRTIRVFAFLLENKLNRGSENRYRSEDEFSLKDSEILLEKGNDIVNKLLPYVPVKKEDDFMFSGWSGRSYHRSNIERACIQIIKKANATMITSDPEAFWSRYEEYMGSGNELYNEIILDALTSLPISYSNKIIEYLCSSFDNNLFDKTSGNGDELLLAKQVLSEHSKHCDQTIFEILEKTVINYLSPQAKERYCRRIEYNKEKNGRLAYWSFWGDLQKEILEVLPYERLSETAKGLLLVLKRRFHNEHIIYRYSNGHSGFVGSPIAGKKLSNKTWLKIMTNKNITSKTNQVPGGFLENSIESFSNSFSTAVSKEPERMIKLMLSYKGTVLDIYIDSLFNGVAHSEGLDNVSLELIEAMILKYSYDHMSHRASHICTLIQNKEGSEWSERIYDILSDIAINHKNPEKGKPNVTSPEDKEMSSFDMLQSNALNCVRGKAARAIAKLMWNQDSLFATFKSTIERLSMDENPAVEYASLFPLWPSYNIDPDWASEIILNLYEKDYRLAGFYESRDMLFLMYPKHRQRVLKIIKRCYESEDEELIKYGSYCLSEMFILRKEFEDEMLHVESMSELQAKETLHMIMLYFNKDEYNSLAKNIITRFLTSSIDLEVSFSRLFYKGQFDLERDKDFLIEILSSSVSRGTMHSFVHYLENESKSVVAFKDVIIAVSRKLLQNDMEKYESFWGIQEEISKLVIGLYDEVSEATTTDVKRIAQECLDIWDLMFEKQIGSVRSLSQKIMER